MRACVRAPSFSSSVKRYIDNKLDDKDTKAIPVNGQAYVNTCVRAPSFSSSVKRYIDNSYPLY